MDNRDLADQRKRKPKMHYIVVLGDDETWSDLEGCTILGLAQGNRRAWRALDNEDFDRLFDAADLVAPVAPPEIRSDG